MKSLYDRLSDYIMNDRSEGTFDALARDLFHYQYGANAPYRRLCEASAITPSSIVDWTGIPAVPAQAFRLFDLSCTPLDRAAAVFHSSGTTSILASKHWMDSQALSLYELSLTTGFRSIFPDQGQLWAVMLSPAEAPASSLSHMLGTLGARRFAGANLQEFADALTEASTKGSPITVFGTAFGLVELLSITTITLPPGSQVIETGGFKGRTRELAKPEFYALLREGFHVDDSACFSEYGMCELASQFYSQGEKGRLRGPRWLRTRCIDPLTNTDSQPGSPGLLRHYDLANLNSVAAIQTQDRALMDGDGSFLLLGRASDAELRGCSLTAEELWSR